MGRSLDDLSDDELADLHDEVSSRVSKKKKKGQDADPDEALVRRILKAIKDNDEDEDEEDEDEDEEKEDEEEEEEEDDKPRRRSDHGKRKKEAKPERKHWSERKIF